MAEFNFKGLYKKDENDTFLNWFEGWPNIEPTKGNILSSNLVCNRIKLVC